MVQTEADIILILPLFHQDERRRPPVQLMTMGTLANKVSPTKVIDGQTLGISVDELADLIVSQKPRLVGISMLSPTFDVSVNLAQAIRSRKHDTLLVAGGKHPTIDSQSVLNTQAFDLLVRGEGDLVLIDIIQQYISAGGDIKALKHKLDGQRGITFSGDKNPLTLTPQVDLKNIGQIDWDILYPELKTYVGNTASVEDQRGCVHDCSYCSASKYHRRVTFRNSGQINSEVKSLFEKGFDTFFLTGDDSFINPPHALEMLKGIASTGLPLKLALNARADSFIRCVTKYGDEFIKALTQAGVTTLHIGIESGDEGMLKLCNKHLKIQDVHNTLVFAKKLGITIETNWIVGLPDDSRTSMENSIALAMELRDKSGPHFPHISYFLPYPGTKDAQRAEQYGLFDPKKLDRSALSAHDRSLIPTRNLTTDQVTELFIKFATTFYSDEYIASLPKELREKAIQMRGKHLEN